MDIRFIWRVGLRDKDALNSQYHVVTLNQEIQQRLTARYSGIFHLDRGDSPTSRCRGCTYHGVQAALIAASARIAREYGYADTVTSEARQKAEMSMSVLTDCVVVLQTRPRMKNRVFTGG